MSRSDRPQRALRRITIAMGTIPVIALGSLVLEHGFMVGRGEETKWLHLIDLACVFGFASLQMSKLLVVDDARRYLSEHRVDFSLLFVIIVQTLVHIGLRGTPEFQYLARHGAEGLLWAFYIAVIQIYFLLIVVMRSDLIHRLLIRMRMDPAGLLVASFAILIAAGTILLALPGVDKGGKSIGWIDAVFTSTSAVCVTGLTVRDTGTQFTGMGWVILLVLIQAGGLGMVTVTGSAALLAGRGFKPEEKAAISKAIGIGDSRRMREMIQRIIGVTVLVEGAGAVILFGIWRDEFADPLVRAFFALFHAISAFCNAGFSLFAGGASLTAFSKDVATLSVIAALIFAGGIGFGVLSEIALRIRWLSPRRRATPLSAHARVALISAATLIVIGATLIHFLEGFGYLDAVFQSVSLRTAGFNSIDLSGLGLPAAAICVILMLIGGAPGGTAGGLKTTTVVILLQRLFRKGGLGLSARRALRVAGAFAGVYCLSAGMLALVEGGFDRRIAFEAASALGTVGMTMGTTEQLGVPGKLLVCLMMFAGRVGPFALVASMLPRGRTGMDENGNDPILIG